ncbi:MAG: Hpt domain-containing protein, partial [Myxococcales bacterium]|nr:Hpt domain-containing protein [Myxococcales bacterium]
MEDEIIEEFLVEAGEGIARIEQDLVALEAEPGQRELVDRIFRDVHTIKGVCGFIGLTRLERVTHAGESLLSQIRAGRRAVDAGVISALLATVDAIRVMVGYVRETGSDGEEDYDALIRRLDQVEQSDPLDSVPPLGEILESRGVPRASIQDALAAQEAGDPRRLGEILVRRGTIRPADLDEALRIQAEAKQAVTSASEGTIRVSVDLLDKLMNLVGELVLVRNQIRERSGDSDDSIASANAQRLDLVTAELQEGVMKTRMQPIQSVWSRYPRVVRDLAASCGKLVRLDVEGAGTELDRSIIEAIADPLTHLVRNAIDHGIEAPSTRLAAGKPDTGRLQLRAYHEGGRVNIELADDGAGIDPAAVTAKAVERGLITAARASQLSPQEIYNLIFLPGFSTAKAVSNLSGRGVGMDVV